VGCESRKIPAAGEVFFLDFPFYRTYQALGRAFLLGGTMGLVMRAKKPIIYLLWFALSVILKAPTTEAYTCSNSVLK